MHRNPRSPAARSANGGSAWHPRSMGSSIHWGLHQICTSALYVALCVLLIAAVALGVLELIGFGSLTQLYGFNQIETLAGT